MNAIPTRYAGVQFRSRLEARWAAMFDLLGWRWEYEPIDLDGYIPDFVLQFAQPLLVEVKPLEHWPCPVAGCVACNPHDAMVRDLHDRAFAKVRSSGWTGQAMLVGAVLMPPGRLAVPRIGRSVPDGPPGDVDEGALDLESFYPDRVLVQCRRCPSIRIWHDIPEDVAWLGTCCDDSDRRSSELDPTALWREAGNRVQWRAPEGG